MERGGIRIGWPTRRGSIHRKVSERERTRGEVLALKLAQQAGIDAAPARIVSLAELAGAVGPRRDTTSAAEWMALAQSGRMTSRQRADALVERVHPHMAVEPGRQRLRRRHDGERIRARAKRADEQMCRYPRSFAKKERRVAVECGFNGALALHAAESHR